MTILLVGVFGGNVYNTLWERIIGIVVGRQQLLSCNEEVMSKSQLYVYSLVEVRKHSWCFRFCHLSGR